MNSKIEELYKLASASSKSPQPKRSLFGLKCPKCGSKLARESFKESIYCGEDSSEFGKRIILDAKLRPGIYSLSVEHLSCKCGYEFASVETEPMGEQPV
jgi:hypothetical protein